MELLKLRGHTEKANHLVVAVGFSQTEAGGGGIGFCALDEGGGWDFAAQAGGIRVPL